MTEYTREDVTERLEKLKSEEISQSNQELLKKFYDYLVSQQLSNSRIIRRLQYMRVISKYIDEDLETVSKSKMVEIVGAINQNQIKEKDLAGSTQAEYRKSLIKFYSDFIQTMQDSLEKVPENFNGEELTDFFTSTRGLVQEYNKKLGAYSF